jgi:hypothetical protein
VEPVETCAASLELVPVAIRILGSMEERLSSSRIAGQVARCDALWQHCADNLPRLDPCYSHRDHEAREIAYDAELGAVEWEAERARSDTRSRAAAQSRIIASFGRFAVTALDLEPETASLITRDFLPAGVDFARRARAFDSGLSRSDTLQACRNAWTACGLQPLLGEAMVITPSILAYSLLYPYTDNYLDAWDVASADKLTFCRRFETRLRGTDAPVRNSREAAVWSLVAMIEGQFPRAQFPEVYECLLAIHKAQEESVAQFGSAAETSEEELLRLSFAKGGASVVADACLVRGWMTEEETQFSFAWGALLQLGDDLQDVHDDLARGSSTLFTRAVARGQPLDRLTLQLLGFCECVAARMGPLPGSRLLKDLLWMSWRSLILAAIADAHEFFSPDFLLEAERCSPFRLEFQRSRRMQLNSRQGLYGTLFDLFVEADTPRDGPAHLQPEPQN